MSVPEQVEKEIVVDAPVDRVWALLTDPDHVVGWWAFDGAEVDPRPGGSMLLRWADHGEFHAMVEEVRSPALFRFRLAALPATAPVPGNSTVVEFTLLAAEEGTRLRVVETGFHQLIGSDESRRGHAEAHAVEWAGGLETLRAYAARLAA